MRLKYKRGDLLEILTRFGNGDTETCVGYYLRNSKAEKHIELTSRWPPVKFQNKVISKDFCFHGGIESIKKLRELKQ